MFMLRESVDTSELKLVTESTDNNKHLYIEGIFAQAEKQNRNKRKYPKSVLESARANYVDGYVSKNRAIGEISHPENRPTAKPEFASHLTIKFDMEGNDIIGKARILDTPQGQIVKGLLSGGVQLGVSTRGLGSVSESSSGVVVKPGYVITAVDIVTDPSAIDAFVQSVNESQSWLVTGNGDIVEKAQKRIRKQKMTNEQRFDLFLEFMNSLTAK